ncbi:MAG: hypothetical protein J2P36_37600 [Ktedonobacteraceae bacterium]|nr:hypothetical protein [Ktedonobacteraceae bacterium]
MAHPSAPSYPIKLHVKNTKREVQEGGQPSCRGAGCPRFSSLLPPPAAACLASKKLGVYDKSMTKLDDRIHLTVIFHPYAVSACVDYFKVQIKDVKREVQEGGQPSCRGAGYYRSDSLTA